MAQHGPHVLLKQVRQKGLKKYHFWGRKDKISSLVVRVREEKRECTERSSNFSLRSTKIEWSSFDGPRFKVRVLG